MLTVFTPVYNRAYIIGQLYESLARQTSRDFEWIVVDDGSTDNIDELMDRFIAEGRVDIRYFKQPNGGKHTAINRGVREARGEMFYIIDSDDYAPGDAVEFINRESASILHDPSFVGISGIDRTKDGKVISDLGGVEFIDGTSIEIRHKYKILGDLAEVFKTDILKKYPFPEIESEKFCPEALIFNRMAKDGYKIRLFSKVIKVIEYLPDGLTSGIVRVRMKSPVASTTFYSELIGMDIPFAQKIKTAINYWRFRCCLKQRPSTTISVKWLAFLPLGYAMHLRDKKHLK